MDVLDALTPDSFIERSTEILEALSNESTRIKIPLISNWENFNRLKDMQLVRFRGLVQNMLDPEIYLETYQTKNENDVLQIRKGKFRDNLKLEVCFKLETQFYVKCLQNLLLFFSGKRRSCVRLGGECAR